MIDFNITRKAMDLALQEWKRRQRKDNEAKQVIYYAEIAVLIEMAWSKKPLTLRKLRVLYPVHIRTHESALKHLEKHGYIEITGLKQYGKHRTERYEITMKGRDLLYLLQELYTDEITKIVNELREKGKTIYPNQLRHYE